MLLLAPAVDLLGLPALPVVALIPAVAILAMVLPDLAIPDLVPAALLALLLPLSVLVSHFPTCTTYLIHQIMSSGVETVDSVRDVYWFFSHFSQISKSRTLDCGNRLKEAQSGEYMFSDPTFHDIYPQIAVTNGARPVDHGTISSGNQCPEAFLCF